MAISRCLTIAGSDSGGGAGIQADLKTFLALSCFGTSAITALTAQNTKGVEAVHSVPPEFVAKQIAMVASDIGVDAAKTGMLFSAEIIRAVAREIIRFGIRPLVVDPVMVATSGDRLLREDAVNALRDELLPLATVVTPNIAEAEVLAGSEIQDEGGLERAARSILARGAEWLVLKGGDRVVPGASRADESVDWVYGPGQVFALRGARVPGLWHGTGCTFSSAICAHLARGDDVATALREAKAYLQGSLEHAERIGGGAWPVNHFWRSVSARQLLPD
jgi:hydroxymethylpyrimidine/phosphomethylpyrimidine kinase